ncbi:hypothetical protein NX801_26190 [Streptomyces sp. LP05-1]|uniref:Secreted protein n=1 Tax=Streptomyces pyxinae TaxID=2970734 RepID=A0ABT2CNQ2_9ACTN|nr:hypothetical protein [Streptomyces sp. LP05-1]MCS0639070.1 hypothetical protein [Streptomyces sp. LP05-1]
MRDVLVPAQPVVGAVLLDTATERVGTFEGAQGGRWYLRPVGGGTEWEADPSRVRPAGTMEHVRALVVEENRTRSAYRL